MTSYYSFLLFTGARHRRGFKVYLASHLPTVIYMDNKTLYTHTHNILLLFTLRSLLPADKLGDVGELMSSGVFHSTPNVWLDTYSPNPNNSHSKDVLLFWLCVWSETQLQKETIFFRDRPIESSSKHEFGDLQVKRSLLSFLRL